MNEKKTLRWSVILWILLAVIVIGGAVTAHFLLCPQWKQTENGRCYTVFYQKQLGWQEIDGKTYYFDPESGLLQTGWLRLPEGTYCLDTNGNPVTGWQNTASGRFHFGEDGSLSTGWLQDANGAIYLDGEGKIVTGWLTLPEGKYYLDQDGHPYTGWMQTDEARYYFLKDGMMAVGFHEIDGIPRYFSSDGNYIPLITPWNPVPQDYKENLVSVGKSRLLQREIPPPHRPPCCLPRHQRASHRPCH